MNTLSILIATKDRSEELQACLRSVLVQVPKPLEVVIIDQSRVSQGPLTEGALRSSGIPLRYVHDPNLSSLTRARNRAISLASGTVFLFLDDDVELAPGYVRELLAVFDKDPLGGVGGAGGLILNFPQTLSLGQRIRSWIFYQGPFRIERDVIGFQLRPGAHPRRALRLNGCNMAFRREVMEGLQFDEDYSGYSFGEDRDFSVLAARGVGLLWVPSARLLHKQAGGGRPGRERFCELRILSWLRFYQRCVPKTLGSLLCYVWLNFGFLTLLLAFWDTATVRGTYRGLRYLLAIALGRVAVSASLQEGWRQGPR